MFTRRCTARVGLVVRLGTRGGKPAAAPAGDAKLMGEPVLHQSDVFRQAVRVVNILLRPAGRAGGTAPINANAMISRGGE